MELHRIIGLEDLSPRQREVFGLLARGLTNAEIARALGVQTTTVKTHVSRIFDLLDVSSRTEAVGLFGRMERSGPCVAAPAASQSFDERPCVAVMPFALTDRDEPAFASISSTAGAASGSGAMSTWWAARI